MDNIASPAKVAADTLSSPQPGLAENGGHVKETLLPEQVFGSPAKKPRATLPTEGEIASGVALDDPAVLNAKTEGTGILSWSSKDAEQRIPEDEEEL